MNLAYLTSPQKNQATAPKATSKIVDADGNVSRGWWRYLLALTSAPTPESGVTLGASPTTFKAPANGTVLVFGGTVSSIQIQRVNTYSTGLTSGFIQLSVGDQVTITYSVAPTVTWFYR